MNTVDRNSINCKQIELLVTGTSWTTKRAKAIIYGTLDNSWRVKFNITGVLAIAANLIELHLEGLVFNSTTTSYQACTGWQLTGNVHTSYSYANPGSDSVFIVLDAGGTSNTFTVAGDLELDSKPSFI